MPLQARWWASRSAFERAAALPRSDVPGPRPDATRIGLYTVEWVTHEDDAVIFGVRNDGFSLGGFAELPHEPVPTLAGPENFERPWHLFHLGGRWYAWTAPIS